MSGFLRRTRDARATALHPAPDDGGSRPAEDAAHRPHDAATRPGGAGPLPAGVDLDGAGPDGTAQRRGRQRRRLRHLRRIREVMLRDLGGLVFEIHRNGLDDAGGRQLVAGKLERLDAVDGELRHLEEVLADRRGMVLREPGIGGTCPTCGELFGSEASFCWACATPVGTGVRGAAGGPAGAEVPTRELRPGNPLVERPR